MPNLTVFISIFTSINIYLGFAKLIVPLSSLNSQLDSGIQLACLCATQQSKSTRRRLLEGITHHVDLKSRSRLLGKAPILGTFFEKATTRRLSSKKPCSRLRLFSGVALKVKRLRGGGGWRACSRFLQVRARDFPVE